MIRSSRKFVSNNPQILVSDGLSLFFAMNDCDEIAVRQLLSEFETSYPIGYGKQVVTKTLAFCSEDARDWLRGLL